MTARLASMALLCCFVSVASPSGASAAEASPSEPTEPLTAQLEQLERMWQDGEHSQYFIRADEIIKRLPYEPTEEAQPRRAEALGCDARQEYPITG
jgi:hypothetical protein